MLGKTTLGLVLISSLGVVGCTAPEKLEGPWIAPSSDPLPKAAVTDTEALAVWHKRPTSSGISARVHVARKLSGSPWTGPFDIGEGTRPEVALSPAGNGIVLFRSTSLSAVSVASKT